MIIKVKLFVVLLLLFTSLTMLGQPIECNKVFTIYGNDNTISITVPNNSIISIYDIIGRLVYSNNNNNNPLQTKLYQRGYYFIIVNNNLAKMFIIK